MRITTLLFLFSTFYSLTSFSQGQWVWMTGTNLSIQAPEVVGTQGVPAVTNSPGGRYGARPWTDKNGNMWLKMGYASISISDIMWQFRPSINQWVWVSGSSASGWNFPLGAPNWTDTTGKFWMYTGGTMQMYDTLTKVWTNMVSGGLNFGVQGVFNATNNPGSRDESTAGAVDKDGHFWFFGGTVGGGAGNDLWEFDPNPSSPTYLQWRWVSGTTLPNQPAVYGTQGVPDVNNIPGASSFYSAWYTPKDNCYWLFAAGNELWRYNITTKEWTWMRGSASNPWWNASFGTQCIESSTNDPYGDFETRSRWTDDCGNLYLFTGSAEWTRTLWRYRPATNGWTWISGPNNTAGTGNYGTQGIPSASNYPAGNEGVAMWRNKDGLWLMGGDGIPYPTYYDALWKWIPDKPITNFTFVVPSCPGNPANFINSSTADCGDIKSYKWNFGDPSSGTADTSTLKYPSHLYSSGGSYTVRLVVESCWSIKDSIDKIVVVPAGSFTLSTSGVAASCSSNNGSITVTPSPAGTYFYTWSGAASGQTSNPTGLAAGIYSVTVTDGSCTSATAVNVNNSPSPTISSITKTDLLCNGTGSGNATVNIVGSTSPYNYFWSNGSTSTTSILTNQITNLPAGNYDVTVTDFTGCKAVSSVLITEPSSITTPTLTAVIATCGNNNGSITAVSSGGTSPLTYVWSNGFTGMTNAGLAGNTYTVTVNDVNGCSVQSSINIASSGAPVAAASINTAILCNGGVGSVAVTVAGGTSNYTYVWSNGSTSITSSTTSQISNLTSQIYSVTVTDNNNCSSVSSVNLTEPTAIATPTVTVVNASCGVNNGSAVATTSGGTGLLVYVWSSAVTGNTNSNLATATYTVTINDANNCTTITTANIGNSNGPNATASVATPILCTGGTGSVSVAVTGGTTNYIYVWSNGVTSVTSSLTSQISNLTSQIYTVTVTDNNNCTSISSVLLTQPTALPTASVTAINASCGSNNGSVVAIATGGTGAYTYSWSSGASSITTGQSSATNLGANTYSLTVTDNNGCSFTTTSIIINNAGPSINAPIILNVKCKGQNTGNAQATITGGTSPYTYTWSDGTFLISNSNQTSAINLGAATYTVTVKDNTGCTSTTTAIVTEPATLPTATLTAINSTCGANDGSVTAVAIGGSGSYTYSWSNGGTQSQISNLVSQTYSLTLTDGNACSMVTTTVVGNTTTLTASTNPIAGCPPSGGSASVTASLGNNPYTYKWSTGSTSQTISNLTNGNYTVTITDASSCIITQTVTITNNSAPAANAGSDIAISQNNSTTLTATGGVYYLWTPANFLNFPNIQNPIASPTITTTYIVTVTDNNGCTATDAVTIFVDINCGNNGDLIFIPTAFSPNGDGQNDYLEVKAGVCLKDFKLMVFNRWGQKVFETTSVTTKWNGDHNGQPADSGNFVFILTATSLTGEKVEKQGNLNLLR